MANLKSLLEEMIQRGASDVHITSGVPAMLRIDDELTPSRSEVLTPESSLQLAYSILTEDQRKRLEKEKELDLSFGIAGLARFRANVFWQRGTIAVAIRQIPFKIMTFEELGLPPAIKTLSSRPKGLVLITGPTGSGKTTTLASILNKINEEQGVHIVTVEDPIEYVHIHKRAIINQREVESDTANFKTALKYILRQDPDVVLIGEMRDAETMLAALTIAETGHLAFATLHTNSAYESINRIVDSFPQDQRSAILSQLAFVLEGVVCQQLVPHASGKGRLMIAEIMVCTPAIRAVIREGKVHQIYGLMQAGQKYGMQTMNMSLLAAYQKRKITLEEAMSRTSDAKELEEMMGRSSSHLATAGSRS
jgi:twitching motility protein PilT